MGANNDIPQVADHFVDVPARAQSIADRFPIYFSTEIEVNRVREALIAGGFFLHGDGDGHWCVDQIHAMALVRAEPANEARVPDVPMWWHLCAREKDMVQTACGQPCNWCDRTEQEPAKETP